MKNCSLKEGMGGVCSQDVPEMLFSSPFQSVLHSPRGANSHVGSRCAPYRHLYRADAAIPSQISCSGSYTVGIHSIFEPKIKSP